MRDSSVLELISDDALDYPALAGIGEAAADPEVQLPVGRYVEVDNRKDHVRLVTPRLEIRDRTGGAVVLAASCDDPRDIPRGLHARLEIEGLVRVRALQGLADNRVDRQIEPALFVLENRSDFERAGVRLELRFLEAEFNAHADIEE